MAQASALAERIRVDDSGCWLWTGATNSKGYGALRWLGKVVQAHRLNYELHIGAISEGMVLDHLCRVRSCINPAHLEPVTNAENIRRGESNSARTRRTGVCQRGHAMTSENTYRRTNGKHECRACGQIRDAGLPGPDAR